MDHSLKFTLSLLDNSLCNNLRNLVRLYLKMPVLCVCCFTQGQADCTMPEVGTNYYKLMISFKTIHQEQCEIYSDIVGLSTKQIHFETTK